MSESQRKIGGDSNKRGNRYEDFFAVFRLVQYAPKVIDEGTAVRLKEQANCPGDDLLLVEPCGSEGFKRFSQRLVDTKPSSFAEFERLP